MARDVCPAAFGFRGYDGSSYQCLLAKICGRAFYEE
jgi:hypothetical protein